VNYIDEAEKYLRHYQDMYRSISNMTRERARIIGRAFPKGYPEMDLSGLPAGGGSGGSSGGDDTYNALFRIKVLTESIDETEKKLDDIKALLEDISQDEGCELYGDILFKWYVERLSREQIAEDSRYSERNIYRIKDKAIRKFAVNLFGLDGLRVV
jgi:hypothetical protein